MEVSAGSVGRIDGPWVGDSGNITHLVFDEANQNIIFLGAGGGSIRVIDLKGKGGFFSGPVSAFSLTNWYSGSGYNVQDKKFIYIPVNSGISMTGGVQITGSVREDSQRIWFLAIDSGITKYVAYNFSSNTTESAFSSNTNAYNQAFSGGLTARTYTVPDNSYTTYYNTVRNTVINALPTPPTEFSMQWGGASVPSGSPYSASYKWTLSNGLTGTTAATRADFTGLQFNTTITATVRATFSLGTIMMNSADSNTLSVILPTVSVNLISRLGVQSSTSFTVQFSTAVSRNITGCYYSTNGGTFYTTIPALSYSYNSTTKIGTTTVTGQTAGSTISFIFRFTYTESSTSYIFTYPAFNITMASAGPTATLVSQTSTGFIVSLPTPTTTTSYTFQIGSDTLIPTASSGATGQTNYTFLNILPAGGYITLRTTQNTLNASGVITAMSDSLPLAIQLIPLAPTNLTLVAGTTTSTAFQISWAAVSVPAGSPFTVSYRWTLSNGATQTGTPITTTSVTITPTISFNSAITVTVVTIYTNGATTLTSAESTALQVQNVPPTPSGLAITGSPTSTGFSAGWTAIPAPGVSGYTTSYIWTLRSSTGTSTTGTATTGTVTANTATLTGLIGGGFYTLSLVAKYDNSSSALFSQPTAAINIQLAPIAPTGLAAVANSIISTEFSVSWTAATVPAGSLSPTGGSFTVSYSYVLGAGTALITTSTTATLSGLPSGTTQTLTVRTIFTSGASVLTSSPSTLSVPLPPINPPPAPTGLALFGTPTPTTFTVEWNKVADPVAPYKTTYEFKNASGNIMTPDSTSPFSVQFQGSISGTTLSVTSIISGAISEGMTMTLGATGTIGAQLTGITGGVGTYAVTPSQTVASTTITATTNKGRATFTAPASTYISSFSMHANYTDLSENIIGSSSSSNSISIQLAPTAPTGLELFGTPTPDTFTVVWEKVAEPPQISNYLTSYEFKRDGVSITGTITDISIPIFVPQVVLASIGTPPDAGTRGIIGIFNNVYYISAVNPFRVWAILPIQKYAVDANYDIYDNNKIYTVGDVVRYSGSIYAMTESVGMAGYNPSTPYWNQIVPTITVLHKATFTGLVSGSFISAFNVYAKYTKSGATALTSVPSNTISVQLAPPVPTITAPTGSTLTNTGFSIQWNNITVPAGSPYTLSYTFSGTYSGLTAGTRTIVSSVTTWPFTVTSLPNGGTVTNLSITATYTSGASTLSSASNTISSVTIPGLPPVITNFTVTQDGPLKTSPFWPAVRYTWTLSGGIPTSYKLEVPGSGTKKDDTISFTQITLTSASSPYIADYSPPTTTYNSLTGQWNPEGFTPRLYVENTFGNKWYLPLSINGILAPAPGNKPIDITAPPDTFQYYYPPGVVSVALATSSNGQKLNVYIRECPFAGEYILEQERSYYTGPSTVAYGFQLINFASHRDLLGMTDSRTTSTNWKLLGEIEMWTHGKTMIKVSNYRGGVSARRSCTLTPTLISWHNTWVRMSFSLDNAITQSYSNGAVFDSRNLVNLSGTNSFNFTF
jgi:hypothetical protein